MTAILDRWLGTPHVAGQRLRGVGVDCVQFVAAFLDEAARLPARTTEVPRLPQDSGAADQWLCALRQVMGSILARHPADLVHDGQVEPGDIVVCRLGNAGGPGHAMIVGGEPRRVYHASRPARRVCWTGLGSIAYLDRIYRPQNKHRWSLRALHESQAA